MCYEWCYAPFTPGGNCRATGDDSANHHWSLVVAPSPSWFANVLRTVSKRHGNEKIIFISATKSTVTRLSGIVETQLRHTCVGVARLICKKNHYGIAAECTTTMSQLSLNSGAINENQESQIKYYDNPGVVQWIEINIKNKKPVL